MCVRFRYVIVPLCYHSHMKPVSTEGKSSREAALSLVCSNSREVLDQVDEHGVGTGDSKEGVKGLTKDSGIWNEKE